MLFKYCRIDSFSSDSRVRAYIELTPDLGMGRGALELAVLDMDAVVVASVVGEYLKPDSSN